MRSSGYATHPVQCHWFPVPGSSESMSHPAAVHPERRRPRCPIEPTLAGAAENRLADLIFCKTCASFPQGAFPNVASRWRTTGKNRSTNPQMASRRGRSSRDKSLMRRFWPLGMGVPNEGRDHLSLIALCDRRLSASARTAAIALKSPGKAKSPACALQDSSSSLRPQRENAARAFVVKRCDHCGFTASP
jgi:hypothetical protein